LPDKKASSGSDAAAWATGAAAAGAAGAAATGAAAAAFDADGDFFSKRAISRFNAATFICASLSPFAAFSWLSAIPL